MITRGENTVKKMNPVQSSGWHVRQNSWMVEGGAQTMDGGYIATSSGISGVRTSKVGEAKLDLDGSVAVVHSGPDAKG